MGHDAINTLRSLTVNAKDLSEPWEHFMTHCAERPEFIRGCTPSAGHPELGPMVATFAREVLGEAIDPDSIIALETPGGALLHGAARTRRGFLSFFYLPEVSIGLAAAITPGDASVVYGRINAIPVEAGGIFVGRGARGEEVC